MTVMIHLLRCLSEWGLSYDRHACLCLPCEICLSQGLAASRDVYSSIGSRNWACPILHGSQAFTWSFFKPHHHAWSYTIWAVLCTKMTINVVLCNDVWSVNYVWNWFSWNLVLELVTVRGITVAVSPKYFLFVMCLLQKCLRLSTVM